MEIITMAIVLLVALLHIYFLVLEMFLWDKPAGLKAFRHTTEQASATKVLAANQGLYNGFIAAGLLWGLLSRFLSSPLNNASQQFLLFFLGCVVAAGIYGAITVSRKILYIQAVPGLIAFVLVLLTPAMLAASQQ